MRIIRKKGEGGDVHSTPLLLTKSYSHGIHTHTCFYALISHYPKSPPALGPLKDFYCDLHAGERQDHLNNLLTGVSLLCGDTERGESRTDNFSANTTAADSFAGSGLQH